MEASYATHRVQSTPEIEEWFLSKGRMDDEEPCTPEEAKAVKDYVVNAAEELPLCGAISPIETAKRLVTLSRSPDGMNDPSQKCFRLSALLLDVCIYFKEQQALVINLLDAFGELCRNIEKSREEKEREAVGNKTSVQSSHDLFAELSLKCCSLMETTFLSLMTDMWRSARAHRYDKGNVDEGELPEEYLTQWTSLNAFLAKSYRRQLDVRFSVKSDREIAGLFKQQSVDLGQLEAVGVNCIRDGLEFELQGTNTSRTSRHKTNSKSRAELIHHVIVEVPTAIRYLAITGCYIYAYIHQLSETSSAKVDSKKGKKVHTSEGQTQVLEELDRDSWKLWMDRLRWIWQTGMEQEKSFGHELIQDAEKCYKMMEEYQKIVDEVWLSG